jgi:hypothetical protein
MSPDTLANALENLLLQAERSHLGYEQEHGRTDWPEYYAEHVHQALGTEFTLEQILDALRAAAIAHNEYELAQGTGRDASWARWYAEHMAGALSVEFYRWAAASGSCDL